MIRVHGYLRLRNYLSRLHITRWLLGFVLVQKFLGALDRGMLWLYPPDVRLRHEFNHWAEEGLGEGMELDHRWFTERALNNMSLSSADRILDLGCGDGWACRLMATRLGNPCRVVGLDVSDEMVRRARTKSSRFEKVAFLCGSAEHIPCRDKVFTKVLSVSAFYYFAHQERVLKELFRVVAPEGQVFILVGLYKGLPNWLALTRELSVPVHVRSADEYKSMFRAAGWLNVQTQELVQECHSAHQPGGHDRALLISARRPVLDSAMGPSRTASFIGSRNLRLVVESSEAHSSNK
jgi:ubiquinone/menaquinone biosynthesis C-methylase UbiE